MNEIKIKGLRQADIAASGGRAPYLTVSRVLANEPGISESVSQHILKCCGRERLLGTHRQTEWPCAAGLALIASDGVTGGLSVFCRSDRRRLAAPVRLEPAFPSRCG